MTRGWRRWAAILTTCTCFVAGAVPYRIRVPPPGQLVALSGDDLRVELDLPPPGGGLPIEAPNSDQRQQGETGKEDGGTSKGSGGRIRRDAELWIELVDMELEDLHPRERKEEAEEEEKAGRWRRERNGGGRDGGVEMGRRDAGHWNTVEIKGKGKERQDKKTDPKRYGWVAGGVRPKGERENVLKVEGKESIGRWRDDNRSGKWSEKENQDMRREKTDGKIWWKSWNGRRGGLGRVGEEGAVGPDGGDETENKGDTSKDDSEGTEKGGGETEGTEEKGGKRRGLILESALVSRGWPLPPSAPATSHRGSSPPHSTLALTFPASHFTHGGLYVVRLVGTGRMVASAGTPRPQRATLSNVKGVRADYGNIAEISTQGEQSSVRNENHSIDDDINKNENIPENQIQKPKEKVNDIESKSSITNSYVVTESNQYTNVATSITESPVSLSIEENKAEGMKTTDLDSDKNDGEIASDISRKHMFGQIVETLENRFKWSEYNGEDLVGDKNSGGDVSEERKIPPSTSRKGREIHDKEVKEVNSDAKFAFLEDKGSITTLRAFGDDSDGGTSSGYAVQTQKIVDGPRNEEVSSSRDVYGGVEGGEEIGVEWKSDFGGAPVKGQWGNVVGKGCRRGYHGSSSDREKEVKGERSNSRGWGCREEKGMSENERIEEASPARGFKTYLKNKVRTKETDSLTGTSFKTQRIPEKQKEKVRESKYGENPIEDRNKNNVSDSEKAIVRMKRREETREDMESYYEIRGKPQRISIENQHLAPSNLHTKFNIQSFANKRHKREEMKGEKATNEHESKSSVGSELKTTSNRTFESRISREATKGCKGNCDSTTRHILAEENVLVSWPTARFTLNILSSTPNPTSPFSTPTSSYKDDKSQNLTFGTFERPVKVTVEIPCGIEKVSRRSRRQVAEQREHTTEIGDSKNEETNLHIVKQDLNNNYEKSNDNDRKSYVGLMEKVDKTENHKTHQIEKETPEYLKAYREKKIWQRIEHKGKKEYIPLSTTEINDSDGRYRRKGEVSHIFHRRRREFPLKKEADHVHSKTSDKKNIRATSTKFDPSILDKIRFKTRKERVTKLDINDDAAERINKHVYVGYAMKREISDRVNIDFNIADGLASMQQYKYHGLRTDRSLTSSITEHVRTKRAFREPEKLQHIHGESESSNQKTRLAPAPDRLPFRLFLVLRYCGPDSTECDEEEANKGNVDIWRSPQTVFTEELADFPDCPIYRHQVILPCEAFGQAGVYMVQVRSNYTKDAVNDGIWTEMGDEGDKVEDNSKRHRRRESLMKPNNGKKRQGAITPKHRNKETVNISFKEKKSNVTDEEKESELMEMSGKSENLEKVKKFEGNEKGTVKYDSGYIRSTVASDEKMESLENIDNLDTRSNLSKEGEKPLTEMGSKSDRISDRKQTSDRKKSNHDEVTSKESSGGGRKQREADNWDSEDSWWESSGDGDVDDGSGEWLDDWGNESGKDRRGGSGDGEYGDDPDGGIRLTSPQRLPEPPPRSLWTSSESIHVHLSKGYVFTVHARSIFPCSDAHVKPDTLEPAPSGVPVLFEYPQCILEGSDRVRVFGRARPDVAAILPPFWMGSDASVGAAATLSHPSLKYVAEKKIYKGKHTAWFDCSLFTERFSEYCFAYASEATTGAVTHVRAQCIPTLPTSDEDRGGWGSWSSWSQCSTTCGSGSRNRYRTCDNPPPRYGAPFCEGTALETERCPPPSGVTYEELQEMCPLGLALSAGDGVNRKEGEPSCRCGGCVVHLQGVPGSWNTPNAGPIKPRARLLASSSQACPGRSFWVLQAEPGHVVGLTVSSLLLPCPRRQWLKARDGDSLSSRLILYLPSSSTSPSLPTTTEILCFSSGPQLLLEFYSFERLEPSCNGGFLAHAHQILANSSVSTIGREIRLAPTTRAISRSSLSVHAAALAFVLAVVALSGGLALNYVFRRRRFNEELKKREKEEEEISDSDSDTKCFIARNKESGSVTSMTSVSDVISLRKLSIGRDGKRREVHMRLREETDEDDDDDDDDDEVVGDKEAMSTSDQKMVSDAPAKAICPKVIVLEPGNDPSKRRNKGKEEKGNEGDEEEEEQKDGLVIEVTRRRRRKGAGGAVRREWRESACPLIEQEGVTQSSISLPSSPTEALREDHTIVPNSPGRPGLSASAPLLLRRSLSFFAAAASASTAGAVNDSSSESGGQSISAAGRQWWRKKMQRFQNGSVSPVREELEETWRLADPQASKEDSSGKPKKKQSSEATPAKECKEKQNRERLLRAGATAGYYPNPPTSTPSNSPSSTTSPEMGARYISGGRMRGRIRARVDERGKCTSEASLAGGASELDLEFDYYDYNVQNAGAAPGSYLGMDPAFLVYIPPFEGSTSPSSEASSASTLQAPPSEAGTDLCAASPPLRNDGGPGGKHRGEYYCINASYARANFQEVANGGAGSGGDEASSEGGREMVSMAEFRRDSLEEGRGSEKETRVEKSPAPEDDEEIKFADEEEEEEVEVERAKKEEGKYGMIKMDNLGLKRSV